MLGLNVVFCFELVFDRSCSVKLSSQMIVLHLEDECIAQQHGLVQAVHHAFRLGTDRSENVEVLVISELLSQSVDFVLHRRPFRAEVVVFCA